MNLTLARLHPYTKAKRGLCKLTMPIIMQIDQLITPLGYNPQRILQERHHDQEAADGRQVRLERIAERVEHILDLARLGSDRLERGGVVCRVGSATHAGGTGAV